VIEYIDTALIVKLAATALLVVVATGFAARFGAFFGAMIAAIPISAGPSYLFIAMENDAEFVARSALTSVGVNPMTVVFLLICASLVGRFGIFLGLVAGIGAWFAGAMAVTHLALTLEQACLFNAIVFVVAIYLSRPLLGDVAGQAAKRGWIDIPLRVIAVVTVVGSAVIVGRLVGPKAAGVVALVPIVWISMAVVIYARQGGATCSAVLANGIVPMIGFWLGLTAVHLLALSHGSTLALLAGLAASVAFTLGLTIARPYIPMYNVKRLGAE
jgi:hypothetical protein